MTVLRLASLRDALMPGVTFAFRSSDRLVLDDIPQRYEHMRKVFAEIGLSVVGELRVVPDVVTTSDGSIYETKLVVAGREYPQGWGRGRGGAAAEPEPEPDGKVDVYKQTANANNGFVSRPWSTPSGSELTT